MGGAGWGAGRRWRGWKVATRAPLNPALALPPAPAPRPQLLTELRSAQEEENRQLLAEVQALSRENRELLERSLESRDHLHREQREYL